MTNIKNKFKDRKPLQTILIIKSFFKSKKCQIKCPIIYKTKVGTYWCHFDLYFQNKKILSANGKGLSKIYALASGYAELYERFCEQNHYFSNPFLIRHYFNYYKPDGFISDEDLCQDNTIKYFKENFFNNDEDFTLYLNTIYKHDGKIPGHYFINLINQEKKLFNFSLVTKCTGTNGLAAGNTLEEALVQGISEWFERYVLQQITINPPSKLYLIDEMQLPQNLIDIISKIQKIGHNKIFIVDFSYNYQVPVCGALVYNLDTYRYYYTLGAAPSPYISIERCLTELYQGLYDNNQFSVKTLQKPYKNLQFNNELIMPNTLRSIALRNFYPFENYSLNQKGKINDKIFNFNEISSNIDLLNYYKKLITKLNINLYYRDISLSKDIKAIKIYCDNKISYCNNFLVNELNYKKKKEFLTTTIYFYNLLEKNLQNYDFIEIFSDLSFLSKIKNYSTKDKIILNTLIGSENLILNPLFHNNYISLNDIVFYLNNKDIFLEQKFQHKQILFYFSIYNYLNSGYTPTDVQKIFENDFNIKISLDEINNCLYIEYIIYRTFLHLFKQNYLDKFINEYLNLFIERS